MDISKLDKLIKPSGTMAISNKSRELKSQGKPVIGFGAGEPDFPSPAHVVNAAINAASDPKKHKYSPIIATNMFLVTTKYIQHTLNIRQGHWTIQKEMINCSFCSKKC